MELARQLRGWTYKVLTASALVFTAAFGVLTLGIPQTASATQTIPYLINFQGRLTDNNGNVLADGSYNIKFRIYNVATGGSAIWEEDHIYGSSDNRVAVSNGLFDIQLGSITALTPSMFNWSTPGLYVEVELPTPATATCASNGCATWTEGAMSPRQPLSSAAYAFNSQTLDGQDESAFGQITATNTWTGVNQFQPTSGVAITVKPTASANGLVVENSAGATQAYFDSNGVLNVGQTIQDTTTTVDIGTAANPFRTGYFGTSVQTPQLDALSSGGTLQTDAGTLQTNTSSGLTVDLKSASATTLAVTNSGGGVAGISATGGMTIGTGQTYNVGASSGEGVNCSAGQVLNAIVVTGGVVTGGACAAAGGGQQLVGTWTSDQGTTATGTQTTVQFTGSTGSAPSFNNATHVLTLPSNATELIVSAKGGGGGGGSIYDAATSDIKASAGGGEGGTSTSYLTSGLASNYYFQVGGGGAGGVATALNPGTVGGNSCFGTNAANACTTPTTEAVGGSGGAGGATVTTYPVGGAGGAASSGAGDVTISGATGLSPAQAVDTYVSGAGGGQGGGTGLVGGASGAGNNGQSGGGGGGALDEPASATDRAGGNGGTGYLSIAVYITTAGTGSPATLQSAYNNSTTPDIVLGTSGLTVQNSSGGVSGDLLDVQSNGGGTNYLAVNTSGITTTGISDSGNFSQTGSGTTFSTGTGAVSLNGATTVAAGDDLTLASGAGSIIENFTSATADNAQSVAVANTNTAAGVTVQGIDVTPTNTGSNPSSGTNTVNGLAFEAAGGTLTANVVTNGIAFNSSTGYTNFISTPSAALTNLGAWTGLTGVALQSGNITTPGNISTTGTGTITSAGSITGPTSGTINGVSINAGALSSVTSLTVTGTISSSYSSATGTGVTDSATNTGSSGSNTVTDEAINVGTGTANGTGSNTTVGLNFGNATAATGNSYFGLNFGTGYNDLLTYNNEATVIVNGVGQLNGADLTSSSVTNTELANSSVQVTAGTNLSGGGTASLGGTAITINAVANPTFGTSVTSPTINATTDFEASGTGGATLAACGAGQVNEAAGYTEGILTTAGSCTSVQAAGNYILQAPTGTQNTITAASGAQDLVLKGTNGTSTDLLDIYNTAASPVLTSYFNDNGALTTTQPITGPTSSTINSLSINSGALSGVTGITQTSGSDSVTSSSTTTDGADLTDSSFAVAAAGSASLLDGAFTAGSTNASGTATTNGLTVQTTLNTSGAGAKAINGVNVAAPTVTACTTGTCTLDGLKVSTITAGAASNITSQGLDVEASGVASGNLYGVNISGITPGLGTQYALNIGSGWNNALEVGGSAIINGTGIIQNGAFSSSTSYSNLIEVGALTSGSIASGFGSIATANTITTSNNISTTGTGTITSAGVISGPTTANTINGLVINSGAVSAVTGYAQSSGNFLQSGTGTFGTGSGAVSLNGATTVAANQSLTADGSVLMQDATASATAVQVENTSNVSDLTVDTLNNIVTTGHLNVGNLADEGAAGRLFTDGFESGNFGLWSGGTTVTGAGNTLTVQSTTVRAGKYAAKFSLTASGTGFATSAITTASTTFSVRAYVYVSTMPTSGVLNLFNLSNGGTASTNLGVFLNTSRIPGLVNDNADATVTGTTALALNTWNEVELRGTVGTSQTVTLYLNGVADGSYTNTNANTMNTFELGEYTANIETWYADNVSVDTGTQGTGADGGLEVADNLHVFGGTTFGGQVLDQTTSNSTIGFQIQNAAGSEMFVVDTTNDRVLIGGSAASGTPTLLVLSSKNSTGDPTGVSGAEYYNSTNTEFRCDQNSTWQDCIPQSNESTGTQSPGAGATTYLTGSSIKTPGGGLHAGTQFIWHMSMTKTAAGVAASSFVVKYGANGTTADTTELTFTLPAETAAVDTAQVTLILTVESVSGTGTITGNLQLVHGDNADTGFVGVAGQDLIDLTVTSGTFADNVGGDFVGLALTAGTADAFTFQQVQVSTLNL